MDKLAEKMSQLPKIADEEQESKFGYIFGVSGPGKHRNDFSNIFYIQMGF
jgi:hypothetical protein